MKNGAVWLALFTIERSIVITMFRKIYIQLISITKTRKLVALG
jgi:hypothetical protein